MKHPEELKTKFLELRARDVSYSRIAAELGVSKPTLIKWGKDMAEEIADLQAAERELVREKLLGNFEQWLGRQVHHFNRLDAEFARREFKYSPTESVFRMMMASRKLLDRYFFEDDRPSRPRNRNRNPDADPARAPQAAASQPSKIEHPKPQIAELDALNPQPPTLNRAENPTETQPLPIRNDQGSASGSEIDTGAETIAGKFISALRRLQASETDSSQGETETPSTPSEIPNSKPEIESGARVETQNPAKTLPFPSQNSGVHNPALSSPPVAEAGRAVPSAPHALANSSAESKIENPNSKIPWSRIPSSGSKTNDQSPLTIQDSPEADFGGESIPISPFESTREWLERQGIQVSQIPKGARIISEAW